MIRLHLGCGKRNFGESWFHVDGGNFPHLNSHDITKLTFSDNTVDLIYSSHLIEYFDREEIVLVLKEWKRVLKPNALLRLAVPDFETMVRLYTNGYPLGNFLGPLYGKHLMGNTTVYHKTAYDFKSLKDLLEANGFYDVVRYDWRKTDHSNFDDHSQAYLPHMDKENGTLISLNVECKKHE